MKVAALYSQFSEYSPAFIGSLAFMAGQKYHATGYYGKGATILYSK